MFAIGSKRQLCSEVRVNLGIDGFASSGLRTISPIIQCSAVPGMRAFARAMPCAKFLRVLAKCIATGWLAAKELRSMRA
jgi:hypothetical protein